MKCSPHHPILFFINTVSNDIIASMLLSPVIRPQHNYNRRGFTPELQEIGMITIEVIIDVEGFMIHLTEIIRVVYYYCINF